MLLAVFAAPAAACIVEVLASTRTPRAGAAAIAGAATTLVAALAVSWATATGNAPQLGPDSAPWFRADGLAMVVILTVATIGITVLTWAARALEPGPDARRTASAGSLVLASTVAVAAADRLSVLAAAWVATTLATLVLLDHGRDPARRAAATRAGRSLGLADLGLVAGVALVVRRVGDVGFTDLAGAAATLADQRITVAGVSVSEAGVVAVLLVVAALARASQLPSPNWLLGTLASPTPTSALLHAGVVNAGAVLLIRTSALRDVAPGADWILAAGVIATIVIAASSMRARPDTKGALALSTSAQMGFMLLAVAVGAPVAAVTHLVGHAMYKSARFLGAGDAIRAALVRRRFAPAPVAITPGRAAAVASLTAVGLTVGAVVSGRFLGGAERWMVLAAVGAALAQLAWSWTMRAPQLRVGAAAVAAAVVGALAVAHLLVVAGLHHLIVTSIPDTQDVDVPAAAALAVLSVAVVVALSGFRHPATSSKLRGVLVPSGRPRPARLSTGGTVRPVRLEPTGGPS